MKIVFRLFCALLFFALLIGAFMLHDPLGMMLVCTLPIIDAIALASSEIVAAINYPRNAESVARQKQERLIRTDNKLLQEQAAKEEKELIAEIKLNELMNPQMPQMAKPPKSLADFDSVIDAEISTKRRRS